MGKNVTCLLEPLTFEPIRSTIWNVPCGSHMSMPKVCADWAALKRGYQQDNGFEKGPVPQLGWGRGINRTNGFKKGPVPQLGWGRGINRTTVLKKAPSPSWAGGGVSTGQRF